MKKDSLYMLLALAAFLAILVACGSGEIVDLSAGTEEYDKVLGPQGSLETLTASGAFIYKCEKVPGLKEDNDYCRQLYSSVAVQESSSSSAPQGCQGTPEECEPPSSSSAGDIPGSSATTPSSSSAGDTPSSNSTTPSSSSVVVIPTGCSNDDEKTDVPDFTCKWNPNSVVSGSVSTKVEVSGYEESCTPTAWAPVLNLMGGTTNDKHPFAIGSPITPKWGDVLRTPVGNQQPVKWPDMPSGASATYDGLWVTVSCPGSTKQPRCKQCETLTITKPPASLFNGGITFTGAHAWSSSSIYYIGETPNFNSNVTITTNVEYCGEVEYDESLIGKVLVAGDVGADKVKVTAKCSISGQVLATASAAVVPDPSLTGTCTWDRNPTSSGKGAIPSGVTLNNSYGRCKIGTSGAAINNSSSYPLPTTAYTATGISQWPASGIVSAGKHNVSTNIVCDPRPIAVQSRCDELIVNAGSENLITEIGKDINVKIGECMDVEYAWAPSQCNQHYCEPKPALKIKCDVDPNFVHGETANVSKLGYLEIIYGSTSVKASGQYNVGTELSLRAAQSNHCSGTACNSYTGETFEYTGVCVDIYLSGNNGTTKEPITNKTAKCRLTN